MKFLGRKHFLLGCCLLLLEITPAFSAEIPDLGNQNSWNANDKKTFIQYLESGKQMPATGNVKSVSAETGEAAFTSRKARYITMSLLTNTMYTVGVDNVRHGVSSNIGAKVLLGGHIFSWVRYYYGMQYAGMDQKRKNGTKARLNHYEFPVGFELALIPLGTPHTRYVILRGGVAAHYIQGNSHEYDFDNSLLGLRGSWNLGLGYEWQIAETNWRVHALVEGVKSMSKEEGSRFAGAGLTTGIVYTF